MKLFSRILGLSIALLGAAAGAQAEPLSDSEVPGANKFNSYMRIYGPANPPYGFVRYCQSNPSECRQHGFETSRVEMTKRHFEKLQSVNDLVNTKIQPLTDLELHGVTELWSLPVRQGDCEDFALLKRKILIKLGWPPSALLMTVVRDEAGDGHAVLTVRTAQGDFVLDNKITDVRIWTKTPYEYLMRQSYLNPKIWVALNDRISPRLKTPISGTASEWKRNWTSDHIND